LHHICRDQAIEKIARVLAGYLDHAAVWKKRCLHKSGALEVLVEPQGMRISRNKLSRSRPGNKARAAQVPLEMTLPTDDINTAGQLGEPCTHPRTGRRELLLRQRQRELAVVYANWQSLDEFRNRVLAVGADQLGERGKQARLGETVTADPV